MSSIDFFPTLVEMGGAKLPGPVDGRSLVPLLKQSGTFEREALFWHYPHYWSRNGVQPYSAVLVGDWKLVELYEDMRVELYNLKDDLNEARDLAKEKAEKTAELRTLLHNWRQSVDAQVPAPNPDFKR